MASTNPPARPAAGSIEPMLPIVAFLVVNRLAGLRWAVAIATIWSIKLVVDRRRRNLPLGRFLPLITAAVIARGVIGIITDSEDVYFGLGIATKFAVAAALVGSILVGRPLAGFGARYLIDVTDAMRQHRAWNATMAQITAIGAVFYTISGSVDVWLLRSRSIEGFVLFRFLASWPLSVLALAAAATVADRGLRKIPDTGSFLELVEARVAALTERPGGPTSDSPEGGP